MNLNEKQSYQDSAVLGQISITLNRDTLDIILINYSPQFRSDSTSDFQARTTRASLERLRVALFIIIIIQLCPVGCGRFGWLFISYVKRH